MKDKVMKIISIVVLCSFIVPIVFLTIKIIFPDAWSSDGVRTQSDYILMLVQCILGVVVLLFPNVFQKNKKIEIPNNLYFLYIIFLYCAIFLGEVRSFYYTIPHWDTILHAFSGAMIAALGFSFISLLNNDESMHLKLTPFFVAFFAFTFAITLGVFWEIYEFTLDGLLGLNMQKFALEGGELLARKRSTL